MAEKQNLYVSRPLLNAGDLIAWAIAQGFSRPIASDDMHVTVAFSRDALDWSDAPKAPDNLKVPASNGRSVEALGDKGAIVLRFESPDLAARWQQFRDIGASWDFPSYKPHVTLTYDGTGFDLSAVKPFNGPLEFGPEVFATIDEDWQPKVAADAAPKRDHLALALDRSSVRTYDQDGHLHVSRTPISKANVCPYMGREIPDWQALGLKPDRTYMLYRDAGELEKGAPTAAGKPLLFGHNVVSADDHDHQRTVGGVTNPEWDAPYLFAALDIWAGSAIKEINSGRQEQLSSAYRYRADMTPGIAPDGSPYDGAMRDIVFNHIALVPEGRAGSDVVVLDSALPHFKDIFMTTKTAVPSRTAAMAHGALMIYAKPKLAQDAKLDLFPLLKGVNAKNIKAKAPKIAAAFDALIRPCLAVDADLDQAEVQAVVEQVAEVLEANSDLVAEAVVDPQDDPVVDDDDAELRAMLKAKGYTDEEIDSICNKTSAAADTEADKAKKADEVKAAADAAVRVATKGMVSQAAMDAAIGAAVKLARDGEIQRQRELREAEAHVRPVVGVLAVAQDSAEGVLRAALKAMKVDNVDTLPEQALRPVFDAHAAVKNTAAARIAAPLAADAASAKSFEEMFPDAKRFLG